MWRTLGFIGVADYSVGYSEVSVELRKEGFGKRCGRVGGQELTGLSAEIEQHRVVGEHVDVTILHSGRFCVRVDHLERGCVLLACEPET